MSAYFSEINIWGVVADGDFFEIAVPSGTDLSAYEIYVYQTDGTIKSGPWSLGAADNTIAGQDVYVIDEANDGLSLSYSDSLALVDGGGTVVQFLSTSAGTTTPTEGPANGLTSTPLGHAEVGEVFQSSDGGSTYTLEATHSKGVVPCFASGTLIDTTQGAVPVELLRPGDVVQTFDRKPRAIRWVHSIRQSCSEDRVPILIKAGSLGPNRPSQDLTVSPQHRILVGVEHQLHGLFPCPSLVPAKALVRIPGIRMMRGKDKVMWHHFALEQHGVVFSNGCASESLLLGKMTMDGLHQFERASLREIFPPSKTRQPYLNGAPAHACLSVKETRDIIDVHFKLSA